MFDEQKIVYIEKIRLEKSVVTKETLFFVNAYLNRENILV